MEGSNFTHINEATRRNPATVSLQPNNLQIEQELLGSILMSNNAYHRVSDIITCDSFFEPLHQRIYTKLAEKIEAGSEITPVMLKTSFADEDSIGQISVHEYLVRLVINSTSIINAPSYAETIQDLYLRRKAIKAGQELVINAADTSNTENKVAIETAQSALDALIDHGGQKRKVRVSLAESAHGVIEDMKSDCQLNCVTTGMRDLDKNMGGGWPRGELSLFIARPSVGKSTFAMSSMLKTARKGFEVLFFSLEMQAKAVAARCISDLAYTRDNPINYSDIIAGRVEEYNYSRLEQMAATFRDLSVEIYDERGLTISNIQSRVRQYVNQLDKEGRSLDLIVVDHIGKIQTSNNNNNRHLELGEVTETLATIALDYNVAMVGLSQLNRGVEGRENKRPTLIDINESGRLEQDAAVVIAGYREGYYLERTKDDDFEKEMDRQAKLKKVVNKFEALLLKQRNGPIVPVNLWCNMGTNSISNARSL